MRYAAGSIVLALILGACSPATPPSRGPAPTRAAAARADIAAPTAPLPLVPTAAPPQTRVVAWHGIRFQYDPQRFTFVEIEPTDPRELAAAGLIETPNPCPPSPDAADCVPNDVRLHLYRRDGLDFWAWLAQQTIIYSYFPEGDYVEALIAGRPAAAWPGDGIFFGTYPWYAVPVGGDVLAINGQGLDWFLATVALAQDGAPPLEAGEIAIVTPGPPRDLWSGAQGHERVAERPLLYEGAFATILDSRAEAVQVRTPDGVTGWMKAAAGDALAARATQPGDQARFTPFAWARVVHDRAIPLRETPRSSAPTLGEPLAPGQQVMVLGVRGDWLRVSVGGSGRLGWARWHYDGARYID